MAGTLKSHPRIQALFRNPRFTGCKNDYKLLAQTRVSVRNVPEDGIISVVCPYCTWENTHNVRGGGGHRECHGPLYSEYTARGARRHNWTMYDCPGYTLVVE
tara:strand:- start:1233 stop:1538 length:306 start_codon:yes stop_codon:yes gene_type:complete